MIKINFKKLLPQRSPFRCVGQLPQPGKYSGTFHLFCNVCWSSHIIESKFRYKYIYTLKTQFTFSPIVKARTLNCETADTEVWVIGAESFLPQDWGDHDSCRRFKVNFNLHYSTHLCVQSWWASGWNIHSDRKKISHWQITVMSQKHPD